MSCKKNLSKVLPQGVWVEKSLKFDTLIFDNKFELRDEGKFSFTQKSKPYMDATQNPTYPINHSGFYSYYFEGEYINLRSFLSSSTRYNKYDFNISTDGKSFSIGRFYSRNQLPAILEFEKVE